MNEAAAQGITVTVEDLKGLLGQKEVELFGVRKMLAESQRQLTDAIVEIQRLGQLLPPPEAEPHE